MVMVSGSPRDGGGLSWVDGTLGLDYTSSLYILFCCRQRKYILVRVDDGGVPLRQCVLIDQLKRGRRFFSGFTGPS